MRERLLRALEGVGADYVEVHWEESARTVVRYSGQELEELREGTVVGGNARALVGGGWGFAHLNRLADLPRHVRLAVEAGRCVSGDPLALAEAPVVNDTVAVHLARDPRSIPLQDKQALCQSYNRQLLRQAGIRSSRLAYVDTSTKQWFANSEGSFYEQEGSYVGLSVSAIAAEGEQVQQAWTSLGGCDGFALVEGLEEQMATVAERAIRLARARPATGGRFTVAVDPGVAGFLAHEAFGHLSEADLICQNARLQQLMRLGEVVGAPGVSITDDGTRPGQVGGARYDDEGVPCRRSELVRDGVLVGRLHSRETAGRMREPLTGNARAALYNRRPIVRMRCTYVEPGEWPVEEMFRGVKEGYYIRGAEGGQSNLDTFTLSAKEAFVIRDGRIADEVKNFTLSGNIFQTLKSIDAVGNDLTLYGSGPLGGCNKGQQHGLPVSLGGPHLRIREALIGGR